MQNSFLFPSAPNSECHSATLYLPCHNYHKKSRMNTLMAANFISQSAYRCLQHVWWPTLSFLLPWELLKQLREGFPYLACHPLRNVFFSDFQPWFGDIKHETVLASVLSYKGAKVTTDISYAALFLWVFYFNSFLSVFVFIPIHFLQ